MKTYPLTPEQFNQLRTRLLQLGITLPDGNDGEIHYKGIVLKYDYEEADPHSTADATKGVLTLSVLKKLLVPESVIWSKVGEWLS